MSAAATLPPPTQLLALAQAEGVALTVVGPEVPLVAGVVDRFRAAGLRIFGPTAAAAQLEGSKAYAKDFLFKESQLRQPVSTLSGGERNRLLLARALAKPANLLVLDEPTEGIQPNIIKEMGNTLKKIRDQKGISILVSEQVLSFALDIADRILVMEKGVIVKNQLRSEVNGAQIASYLSV